MADIKISQLGAAIAVGDTDLMPIVSGGNTLKATGAQVKEYAIGDTNISTIGDGSVTGAISSLNTEKQPKTLATPLTIGGVSKTTVEAALNGLNSENQTLANNIAYINTSSTTASKAYVKGEQFILNGILRKAKTAISSGATLTLNSNYENADSVATQITPQDISSGITAEHGTFNTKQAYIIGDLVIIAFEETVTETLGSGQTLLIGIPTPKGNFQTFMFKNGSAIGSGYTDNHVFATNNVISSGDQIAGSLVYVKA